MNTNYVLFGSFTVFEDEIQIITMLTNVHTSQIYPIENKYYDKEDKKNMIESLSNTVFNKLDTWSYILTCVQKHYLCKVILNISI